jgi:hypothetical protein
MLLWSKIRPFCQRAKDIPQFAVLSLQQADSIQALGQIPAGYQQIRRTPASSRILLVTLSFPVAVSTGGVVFDAFGTTITPGAFGSHYPTTVTSMRSAHFC